MNHDSPSDGPLSPAQGHLPGSVRDGQSVTSDWQPLQPPIDGVVVRDVLNVTKNNGLLTEVYRRDWGTDALPVEQVFQNLLHPGALSGWHVHQHTTDRIFVNLGLIKIVLYDARTGSPTHGRINIFRLGIARPALVVIPPGVWHAVENIGPDVSALLNLVDRAYRYEQPDHWRLPIGTPEIPYSFRPPASGSREAAHDL